MSWKWLISLVVTLTMLFSTVGTAAAAELIESDSQLARAAEGAVPTYQEAYEAMIALKEEYPEGMEWTNFTPYGSNGYLGDSYIWKGGRIYGADRGVGCAAFAFILSDAAFGGLPARTIENFTFEDVKVGDILRVNGNSHSVIVLQKSAGGVIVAEANYNKSVHWGRAMSEAEVLAASYIITRYPENHIPADAPDADKVVQGGSAGTLSWSLTNAGVLTISGNGVIPDYSSGNLPPWNGYSVSTVIIEKGVTGIGSYAFYESGALSIYIPDSIVNIGEYAFYKSALLSVTVPGTVETIGDYAFYECENLTSVTVPEGVKTIGNNAFRGCTSLTCIDFPASITSVGSGAFMSCDMMTRVRFMPGTGTVTLGAGLFAQCWRLTSVTLPYTADCISDNMFSSCTSLRELYIPASVKEIGEDPFTSCYLEYIYFGGTEAQWKALMNAYLEASLRYTQVICGIEFDDPFAADPDDPGDIPADPDDGEDETDPDEGEKDPTNPDDGEDETDPDERDSAHEHDWSENWNYDGNCHWHECDAEDCPVTDNSKKNGYREHSYGSWVIDVSATVSRSGSRHRDCTVCHYRQTDSIPAIGSSDSSNGKSDSSSEPGKTSRTGGISNLAWQDEYIQKNDEPLNFVDGLIYSELPSGSESEPADTESMAPQGQKESETVVDELSEGDKKEDQQEADEEAKAEISSKPDKASAGIIVPVVAVSAAGVLGAVFVFLRKRRIG